jgi:hypothetical protein
VSVSAQPGVGEREQRVLDVIAKQRARRPKLRDAHITMAHGAGGKATQTLIEGVLVPAFASPALDALADVATVEAGAARLAFTTDSFVVKPLRFPGGSIGELAVNGESLDGNLDGVFNAIGNFPLGPIDAGEAPAPRNVEVILGRTLRYTMSRYFPTPDEYSRHTIFPGVTTRLAAGIALITLRQSL